MRFGTYQARSGCIVRALSSAFSVFPEVVREAMVRSSVAHCTLPKERTVSPRSLYLPCAA